MSAIGPPNSVQRYGHYRRPRDDLLSSRDVWLSVCKNQTLTEESSRDDRRFQNSMDRQKAVTKNKTLHLLRTPWASSAWHNSQIIRCVYAVAILKTEVTYASIILLFLFLFCFCFEMLLPYDVESVVSLVFHDIPHYYLVFLFFRLYYDCWPSY